MTKLRLSVDRLPVLIGLVLFASCASGFAQNPTPNSGTYSPATTPTELQTALHKVQQEIAVAGLLQSLHKAAPHGRIVFENVHIIDPASGTVTSNQSVIVEDDRIVRVGDPSAGSSQTSHTMVIDGHGRYLSPGLTDMHVHSSSAASWLLDLSNGVTGVRDMAGFPWLLKARENVSAGRMLAPSLAVAGPLINAFPLEGYAVAIRSPLEGRRTVRQQAACGYDFIKVWNVVSRPVFDAVAEQAHLEGMDLVGHVPQGIPIRHAVESGMRTMEHLKGFIDDQTLKRGETDYSAAVSPNVWNTPTLYAGRDYARGAEAREYLAAAEMRYVPLRGRNTWIQSLAEPETPVGKLRAESRVLAKDIARQLVAAHAHFLAGTDSDNYAFQVSGFALIEELHLLQDAGLSAVDALRSATTEAASAMREPAEFGQVREGMRADLLLLDGNPLEDVVAIRQNRGVMAHGFWLTRDKLDAALTTLAQGQSEADQDTQVSETAVRVAAEKAESLTQEGFVFDARMLTALARTLRAEGYGTSASRFETLADIPRVGPCAEPRP
jgi:imidazolonepropionase-like amidohydrolase